MNVKICIKYDDYGNPRLQVAVEDSNGHSDFDWISLEDIGDAIKHGPLTEEEMEHER